MRLSFFTFTKHNWAKIISKSEFHASIISRAFSCFYNFKENSWKIFYVRQSQRATQSYAESKTGINIINPVFKQATPRKALASPEQHNTLLVSYSQHPNHRPFFLKRFLVHTWLVEAITTIPTHFLLLDPDLFLVSQFLIINYDLKIPFVDNGLSSCHLGWDKSSVITWS